MSSRWPLKLLHHPRLCRIPSRAFPLCGVAMTIVIALSSIFLIHCETQQEHYGVCLKRGYLFFYILGAKKRASHFETYTSIVWIYYICLSFWSSYIQRATIFLYVWNTSMSGIGYVTSEKVSPSPIMILADMKCAIDIEKRQSRGARSSLKDCLNRTIAEYKRSVTVKKHRVDVQRKTLIYNLRLIFQIVCASMCKYVQVRVCEEFDTIPKVELRLRAPQDVLDMVHAHYDKYRHENSGHVSIRVFFAL